MVGSAEADVDAAARQGLHGGAATLEIDEVEGDALFFEIAKIARREDEEEERFGHQNQRGRGVRAISLRPEGKAERAGGDQCGDGNHRERDAIDGDMPAHAKRLDPRNVVRELIASDRLETIDKANHSAQHGQRDEQCEVARGLSRKRHDEQHHSGDSRNSNQRGNRDHVPRTKR